MSSQPDCVSAHKEQTGFLLRHVGIVHSVASNYRVQQSHCELDNGCSESGRSSGVSYFWPLIIIHVTRERGALIALPLAIVNIIKGENVVRGCSFNMSTGRAGKSKVYIIHCIT